MPNNRPDMDGNAHEQIEFNDVESVGSTNKNKLTWNT